MTQTPKRTQKKGTMGQGPKSEVVLRPDETSQVSEITFPPGVRRQTSNASSTGGGGGGGGGGSQVSQGWRDEIALEDAEQALLSSVEGRRPKVSIENGADDGEEFQPAVHGERPPLGAILGKAFDIEKGHANDNKQARQAGDSSSDGVPSVWKNKPKVSLTDVAKRVQLAQRVAKLKQDFASRASAQDEIASTVTPVRSHNHRHRRVATLLASIDEDSRSEAESRTKEEHIHSGNLNVLLHGGLEDGDDEDDDYVGGDFGHSTSSNEARSQHPFVSSSASVSSPSPGDTPHERQPLLTSPSQAAQQTQQKKNACARVICCVADYCNPTSVFKRIRRALFNSFLSLSLPLFAMALIIFYGFGDFELDFLPGKAGLAWWCNFVGRLLLMLDCARFTQWLIIDCLTLGSKYMVDFMGPWVTIFLIQSKGWPFVFTAWGLWSLCLLHGDNIFQRHWLYFTGIKLYSPEYSGSIDGQYIIDSVWYFHFLLSLLLAGVSSAVKRTAVSIYFGRRNFEEYKPKLEAILNDIIIISEVAELAESADTLPEEYAVSKQEMLAENLSKKKRTANVRWSSVKFSYNAEEDPIDGSDGRARLDSTDIHVAMDDDHQQNKREAFAKSSSPGRHLMRQATSRDSSGKLRIRNLLDRWDEPVNKSDRAINSTINDILKFRKALTYMDLEHPFSIAFGTASTRDQCISSAQNVYRRLLKLSPGSKVLSFDILRVLAMEEDGREDPTRLRSIRALFRPDASGELPLIAFIQSCDTVYKKLRYFRASVGNSSVIDKVLESIVDAIFGFILALVILQFNSINPWPVLVSMSTLLLTFTFAVGPSAAKSIEGILMITGRRPYDIGDRIIISDSPGAQCGDNSLANSWFVEDITLLTTTLRFANSNEVATISNSSIAASRIINCARSSNALVALYLKFDIKLHDEQTLDLFRESLDNYVSDNPRIWDLVLVFRCEEIDPDYGFVKYKLVVRSRNSWQVAARVMQNRAELWQFCTELSRRMGVTFGTPVPKTRMYVGSIEDLEKPLKPQKSTRTIAAPELMGSGSDGHERSDSFQSLVKGFREKDQH